MNDDTRYVVLAGLIREVRTERKQRAADLAELLSPHKKAIADIVALCPDDLADDEATLLEEWRQLHATLTLARHAKLLSGVECPALALPAGCSLRLDRVVDVVDFDAVPREYFVIDLKAVRAAEDVPGTSTSWRPTLVCK